MSLSLLTRTALFLPCHCHGDEILRSRGGIVSSSTGNYKFTSDSICWEINVKKQKERVVLIRTPFRKLKRTKGIDMLLINNSLIPETEFCKDLTYQLKPDRRILLERISGEFPAQTRGAASGVWEETQ